jgi:hypothetical protein
MENMASNSFSTTHACSMEEEIGVYMIAIVVVISLRVADSNGVVEISRMTCSGIAEHINSLLHPSELSLIYVDALALDHGIQLFKGNGLRQKAKSNSPSTIGLRWVVETQNCPVIWHSGRLFSSTFDNSFALYS